MAQEIYQRFYRLCARNLAIGTALAILPAGAFYWFVFEHTQGQMLRLITLGAFDLAFFFPFDLLILRWTLRPVGAAFEHGATYEQRRAGLARLLDSPWIVLVRVFGPHAIMGAAGINVLVILANKYWDLGINPRLFPLYWILNLTILPIAHVVYEFTAMERATQPLAAELTKDVRAADSGAHPFTLTTRMRLFFPLLALAPMLVMIMALVIHDNLTMGPEALHEIEDLAKIGVGCSVLFLFLMWVLGGALREQTNELIRAVDFLGKGHLDARAQVFTTSEFGQLADHINDMARGLGERQRLRELFGAYMTDDVAEELLATGDAAARNEKRFCAIMFLDVRGFTRFGSEHPPDVVVSVLNRLLGVAVSEISQCGGNVNKFLGDGLLAVFGAPHALDNPCAAAIDSSLRVLRAIGAVNAEFEREGVGALKIGIGLHAGEVIAGTIGSPGHKLEYTVIGDAVNVASRIEQLTKKIGVPLLVSHEVIEAAGGDWACLAGEPIAEQVRGLEREVILFPIVVDGIAAEA